METQQIVLASRPSGKPGFENFRTESIELPALKENEVLLQGLYFSVDPYMRGRMNDTKTPMGSFQIGQPISGGAIAKVVESRANDLKAGDLVFGRIPWQAHTISQAKGLQKIDAGNAPVSYFLGILGMPGLTAYFGLYDICKPKAGETGVVSGAAGAVGMVVGQLAKIKGCRVIGITGSDEKAALLKMELGFDEVINYKTSKDLKTDLAEKCPSGIDFYFDNVGGEISDAVLSQINLHARCAVCGQISTYNNSEIPMGPRLQPLLLGKNALMQGFTVNNYQDRFGEGIQQLSEAVQAGKLKYRETILKGFDQLPRAFIGLFNGENTGKMIVEA